jgi:hypothetical protein
LPVSQISSRLRWHSRSSRRLDGMRLSRVGDERQAAFQRRVSRRPSPNWTCTFRYASSSPEDVAKSGDVSDSADRVCVERRVSRPHRLGDLCPQIVPPSRSSIAFLLPFALYAAFPRSDYYGSSALGGVPLRPLRLAQFRAGRTPRVPVFRSSTLVSLGGELYPWRCRRRTEESMAIPSALCAPSSGELPAPPLQIARPPPPSRHGEAAIYKYTGFRRPLRYLTIDTAVVRPAGDGPHPVQLRPICL